MPHSNPNAGDAGMDPAHEQRSGLTRTIHWAAPAVVCVILLATWEAIVRIREIPPFQLAAPSLIARTIKTQWPALSAAWMVTLGTMLVALSAAVVTGVAL